MNQREAAPKPPIHTEIFYGDHPEQHMFLSQPAMSAESALGTVMVLHGGYWRGSLTSALMDPIAQDLTARGWTVANVEYRRVDAGGGWPLPFIDARSACKRLAS